MEVSLALFTFSDILPPGTTHIDGVVDHNIVSSNFDTYCALFLLQDAPWTLYRVSVSYDIGSLKHL